MAVTREQVEHVAALARLTFAGKELTAFTDEMNQILAFFETLGEVDTEGVEPAYRVLSREDVFRADEPGAMLSADDALANAPDPHEGFFRVPGFLPDE